MTDTKTTAAESADNTVTLGDGAAAVIRKGKGRDLLKASRMAGGNDPMRIAFALIAVLVTVDGRALTVEDVEDMDMNDVLKLQGRVMGNAGSLPANISPN